MVRLQGIGFLVYVLHRDTQDLETVMVPERNLERVSPAETIRDDGETYSILDLGTDEHITQQGEQGSTVELRVW